MLNGVEALSNLKYPSTPLRVTVNIIVRLSVVEAQPTFKHLTTSLRVTVNNNVRLIAFAEAIADAKRSRNPLNKKTPFSDDSGLRVTNSYVLFRSGILRWRFAELLAKTFSKIGGIVKTYFKGNFSHITPGLFKKRMSTF